MARDPHSGFTGLDVRKLSSASDPKSARVATNIDLTIAGGYRARDPFIPYATVDSKSKGLYAIGGFLRCAIPGGDTSLIPPPGLVYDAVGDGTDYDSIDAVTAAESIGSSNVVGVFPYLVIKRGTTYEHHWIRTPIYPAGSSSANTKITLPFVAGPDLIKMAQKLWATDTYNNAVRYSSVVNGPTDWVLANDAGLLPVQSHITGNRQIQGLGYIDKKLVVFLADAVQIWKVYADPTNPDFGLDRVIGGPGTTAPRSIENVLGDVFYYARGGFQSLAQNTVTGQYREGSVGRKIQPLTKNLDPEATPPVALWSQARQQYLCAFGSTIYAYTFSRVSGDEISGWTTWELPAAVESMVELDGDLYFRAGDVIYKADPTADTALESGYDWEYRSQFLGQKTPHVNKQYNFLEVVQDGESEIALYDDPRNPDVAAIDGLPLDGPTATQGYLPIPMVSQYLAIGITGTNTWQMDQFDIHYDELGL